MSATNSAAPATGLVRIDSSVQKRLDELMSRNTEGDLMPREKRELEALVEKVERLSLENARRLAACAKPEKMGPVPGSRRGKVPA